MSKISLKHSGGNVVSLNSPTSAPTSADVAFKLPNADGTSGQVLKTDGSGNLSFGADTGGKILQYKIVKKTDGISTTTTSHHEISSDFRIEITPTASNTTIVIQAELSIADATGYTRSLRIVKNTASDFSGTQSDFSSPDVYNNDTDGHVVSYINTANSSPISMRVFETSGNTTARTYGITWSTSGGTLYLNRWNNTSMNAISTFSVMEVAA